MKKELSVRPKLNKGQLKLYTVILVKLEADEPIYIEEARQMWIDYVAKEVKDGVPRYWNFWWENEKGERVGRWQPMDEWSISNASTQWLLRSLGALILKGYLKIIPQVQLKELKSCI